MQAPILIQVLTPAPASNAPAAGDKPAADRDLFSKLLGDAKGRQSKGEQGGGSGAAKNERASSVLAAQEVGARHGVVPLDDTAKAKLLAANIGPEEAAKLISQIDALQAHGDGAKDDQFKELKEALQDIVDSGEGKDVAELLDGLADLPTNEHQPHQPERTGMMQRMMHWLNGALERQKDAMVAAIAPVPDSTVQSLQAANFRPDDVQDPAAAAPQDEEKTKEVTVITPLAQNVMVVMPEWARKLGDEANAAPEETIAPLSLGDGDLPEVNLPGSEDLAADTAPAVVPKHAEKIALPNFGEQLKALPEHLTADEAANAPVTIPEHAHTATVLPVAPTQSVGSTGFASIAHAQAPNVSAMPHVPLTEQVHMAVTQLSKDGIDRITLQLEPADLGRVEIRMEIHHDGAAKISFLVDKPETLDHLSRDARSLERALQETGVRADTGSMQFNLRQQPSHDEDNDKAHADKNDGDDAHLSLAPVAATTTHYTINAREGVDIHA